MTLVSSYLKECNFLSTRAYRSLRMQFISHCKPIRRESEGEGTSARGGVGPPSSEWSDWWVDVGLAAFVSSKALDLERGTLNACVYQLNAFEVSRDEGS